jgi:hypothetical protein
METKKFALLVSQLIVIWEKCEYYGLRPSEVYDVAKAEQLREQLKETREAVTEAIYKILYPGL